MTFKDSFSLTDIEGVSSSATFGMPRVIVVGCGGVGCNTVSHLLSLGLEGAVCSAISTDGQELALARADIKILLDKKLTRSLGVGGKEEVEKKAAEAAKGFLEEMLEGAELVFVTAGLGGWTGAASIVARIARDQGAMAVGAVTMPFHLEERSMAAERGLEELRAMADTLLIIDNNRLSDSIPSLPIEEVLSVSNQMMAEIIKGVTEAITLPSLINLDYADVRTVMSLGGQSFMVVEEGDLDEPPEEIVRHAFKQNPILEAGCRGAKGCLLHLTGGPDLTLKDAADLASALTQELDEEAHVIWGARIRDDFKGRVRLMAIITGVKSAQDLRPSEAIGGQRVRPTAITVDAEEVS